MGSLDYRGLATLAAIIEQGSFERAAAVLSISQPAVSHRLRALEESTGALLLIRGQPPQATAHGQRLIAHYRQVLLLEAGLNTEAPTPGLPDLAVAANADSAATWLPEALGQVLTTPLCQVELLLADQDQTLLLLRQGRVVGCVTSAADAVAGTTVEALGGMSYRCVATPAFARRWFAGGINAATVKHAPALIYDRSDTLHTRFLRQLGLDDDCPYNLFPSAEGFVRFILSGHGYGLAPWLQVREDLASGALVEIKPGATLTVPLYWHQWNIRTPLTALLSNAIVGTARRLLDVPAA